MKTAYDVLQKNPEFIEWKAHNSHYSLIHCFFMQDKQFKNEWHFGFYNKDDESIMNFIVSPLGVKKEEHQELAKFEGQEVLPLDMSKVTISRETAEKIIEKTIEEEQQGGASTKIFLLQHIPMIGTVWNVTAVTLTFKSLNVKIDAATGEIKLKSLNSLFDMKHKE